MTFTDLNFKMLYELELEYWLLAVLVIIPVFKHKSAEVKKVNATLVTFVMI